MGHRKYELIVEPNTPTMYDNTLVIDERSPRQIP